MTAPEAAGALRAAAESAERRARDEQIEIVWTGPRIGALPLRRTEQVLLQLIESAQSRVTIASYVVFKIA